MLRRRFFISVSAVGSVSLAGCISFGGGTSVPTDDPEAVAKTYYNAKWSNDARTMQKLVHSKSEAAGETDMRSREIDREVTGVNTVSKYEDITIVELDTTDKYIKNLRVTLRKEDNEWKVFPGCVQRGEGSSEDSELCSPQ